MKASKSIIYVLTSAAAVVMSLVIMSAAALTNLAYADSAAFGANAFPARPASTPALATSLPVSHAAEDIRDIRQPRHVPTPWFWIVVATGMGVCIAAAFVVWACVRQSRIFELSPNEIALKRLEEARALMDPAHAREYCFVVSKIIRGYVEEQLRLRAPRLTTEEFLHEIVEVPGRIVEAHRGLLGDFLQHCDLAKFAGWRYSLEALADIHETASEFVLQSSATQVMAAATNLSCTATTTPERTLVGKQ